MKIIYQTLIALLMVTNVSAACSLSQALEYQYGPYNSNTRVSTRGDTITEFNLGTMPTASEIITAKENCRIAIEVRQGKKKEIIADGLSRVQIYLPGVKDWDTLELIKELWLSIAPAARQSTVSFQAAIDIYQYGLDKVVWVNTASEQDIEAYDPEADNGWP